MNAQNSNGDFFPSDRRLDDLLTLAGQAGNAILKIYAQESHDVCKKSDNSPVTQADRASHEILLAGLRALFPSIPVISEEADLPEYPQRQTWEQFWLVDPMDGTQHFLKRDGQFVVNLALVHGQTPIFGLIYAPTEGLYYYGGPGRGCFRQSGDGPAQRLTPAPFPAEGPLTVLGSSDDPLQAQWLSHWRAAGRVVSTVKLGSALKFCRLAEGAAHAYVRGKPTMEWDVAAGHALALGCGKTLLTLPDNAAMAYNKPSLLNPGFICR